MTGSQGRALGDVTSLRHGSLRPAETVSAPRLGGIGCSLVLFTTLLPKKCWYQFSLGGLVSRYVVSLSSCWTSISESTAVVRLVTGWPSKRVSPRRRGRITASAK
jgi:hypothetical protein